MSISGRECVWEVHGLRLAGLSWGDPEAPPVLCLHGWLDNAASFDALASLLPDYYLVAPDLTGQGQSDRRSADATYQIWDDLPEVKGIVETLGWERFRLIGHSRGAVIASLFCSSYPECVQHLVMLDAVMPEPVPEAEFPQQMRRFLQDKGRLLSRENRVFDSFEAAAASREEQGIGERAARQLAERNLRACEGGYTWTTDPRLRGASAVKLTRGQVDAVLQALDMPTLLLLAEKGFGGRHQQLAEVAQQSIRRLQVESLPGGHHFHMEEGAAHAAELIKEFFTK
jgi:pimeloyl-ACP methyl ester carboxylesterase